MKVFMVCGEDEFVVSVQVCGCKEGKRREEKRGAS